MKEVGLALVAAAIGFVGVMMLAPPAAKGSVRCAITGEARR